MYCNSAQLTAGSNEDFTITNSTTVLAQAPTRVRLLGACIPYTWNNVTAENNAFQLQDHNGNFTITVAAGYYTGTALATAIEAATNAQAVQNPYTVTYTGSRFSFATTNAFSLNFQVSDSAAVILGFAPGATAGPAASITSPNYATLSTDNEIMVGSTLIGGVDNGIIAWQSASGVSSWLARVPISGSYGSIIDFTNALPSPYFVLANAPQPLTSINLFLAFPSGLPITLNGATWSALLEFA